MSTKQILIIDDEEAVCWALQRALTRAGHGVAVAASAEQGLALARQQPPDAIVLDVRLPGMDGLTALRHFRATAPDAAVVVVTAFGSLPTAVQAVEGGAFDYLPKPFDLSQALDAIDRALRRQPIVESGEAALVTSSGAEEFVGVGPAMQAVFKRIALVAPRDACVLITGESGTGKELAARAIHRYSARRDRPFLPVHVAALNPNLVESELFGHVKGAFTGAAQARAGLLALADGGTIFLDEMAEIPPAVQVKLLRVLEHREVLPVGANQPQPLDIRILAATHQDLTRCVADGRLRHDLYFRLNVFEVRLPPLRDRPEDIAPLAEHFLKRFEPRALPLADETIRYLQAQLWPGNVREFRNALEHAAIVAHGGVIRPDHFPCVNSAAVGQTPTESLHAHIRAWVNERVRSAAPQPPADMYDALLREVEPALLDEVLTRTGGNRWVAARWLGLNRTTVRRKLAQHGLHQPTTEPDDESESGPVGNG